MFGAQAPYAEYQKGSKLNNFISDQKDTDLVVLLDEFEKLDPSTKEAFFNPFSDGAWEDRRVRSGKKDRLVKNTNNYRSEGGLLKSDFHPDH